MRAGMSIRRADQPHVAVDGDAPAIRAHESRESGEGERLAGARGAEQREPIGHDVEAHGQRELPPLSPDALADVDVEVHGGESSCERGCGAVPAPRSLSSRQIGTIR